MDQSHDGMSELEKFQEEVRELEKFQEEVRQLSITGYSNKEKFFYNGWSQVVAMKQLHHKFKLCNELNTMVQTLTSKLDNIDINVNVRKEVKKILMYPNYNFTPFKLYKSDADLKVIKKGIIKIVDGKLFLLIDKINIKLDEEGEENDEIPHITLINSDNLTKEHKKLEGIIIDDLKPYMLSTTGFIRDYPPFSKCIVINMKSDKLKSLNLKYDVHTTIWKVPRKWYF